MQPLQSLKSLSNYYALYDFGEMGQSHVMNYDGSTFDSRFDLGFDSRYARMNDAWKIVLGSGGDEVYAFWTYGGNLILGGSGDDRIGGSHMGYDTIKAGSGNDRIVNYGGSTLDGGAGDDFFVLNSVHFTDSGWIRTPSSVRGGTGSDIFDPKYSYGDEIRDFQVGKDLISYEAVEAGSSGNYAEITGVRFNDIEGAMTYINTYVLASKPGLKHVFIEDCFGPGRSALVCDREGDGIADSLVVLVGVTANDFDYSQITSY